MNGDISMWHAGRWPIATYMQNGFTDYNLQYFPGNPNQTLVFGAGGLAIMRTSSNPEAGWTFIKQMISKDVQDKLVGDEDVLFTSIPVRRSSAELMTNYPPSNINIFYDAMDGAVGMRMVEAPIQFNQFQSIMTRYTNLIWANEMSVEDAMAAAQAELERALSCDA